MLSLLVYVDECIDQRILPSVELLGCNVLTVQEAHTSGATDEAQLLYATSQGRLLLTHNQVHFRRLHERFVRDGRDHAGIITIPQTTPRSRLELRVTLMLEWVATFPDRTTRLFRWGELQQLIIHGYRPPQSRCSEADIREALGRHPRPR